MQYIETACLRQRKPNSREADHKLKINCACHWIPGRVTFNNEHPAVTSWAWVKFAKAYI